MPHHHGSSGTSAGVSQGKSSTSSGQGRQDPMGGYAPEHKYSKTSKQMAAQGPQYQTGRSTGTGGKSTLDVKKTAPNNWEVYSHCGNKSEDICPVEWAKNIEQQGAGEILLTSIDKDGTMEGYDVEITRKITDAVSIPVISAGGAGNYQHMADIIDNANVSAVAASSIYHFTEQTPLEAKSFLASKGFNTRLPYEQ